MVCQVNTRLEGTNKSIEDFFELAFRSFRKKIPIFKFLMDFHTKQHNFLFYLFLAHFEFLQY